MFRQLNTWVCDKNLQILPQKLLKFTRYAYLQLLKSFPLNEYWLIKGIYGMQSLSRKYILWNELYLWITHLKDHLGHIISNVHRFSVKWGLGHHQIFLEFYVKFWTVSNPLGWKFNHNRLLNITWFTRSWGNATTKLREVV